jgi:rubrerythrin
MMDDELADLLRSEGDSSGFKNLGVSKLARAMTIPWRGLYGKWCGPCGGIWFGLPLEAECPACGQRRGASRR